jgi:hypothetical protein
MKRSPFPGLLLVFLLGLAVGIAGTYLVLRPTPTEPQPTLSDAPEPVRPRRLATASPESATARDEPLAEELPFISVCSFNIQFLGHFKKRDDEALATILNGHHPLKGADVRG